MGTGTEPSRNRISVRYLPPDSHRSYLVCLNNDSRALDKLYAQSVTMMQSMAITKKSKIFYLLNNIINDQICLIQKYNFKIISNALKAGSSNSLCSV